MVVMQEHGCSFELKMVQSEEAVLRTWLPVKMAENCRGAGTYITVSTNDV